MSKSDHPCRICGRPGVSVFVPAGFALPPGETNLILCQWHRASNTRQARRIAAALDPITSGFAAVQAECDRMLAENEANRKKTSESA